MDNENKYVKKFKLLPLFSNILEDGSLETSICETFKQLDIKINTWFCIETILGKLEEGYKEWNRMLYISNTDEPIFFRLTLKAAFQSFCRQLERMEDDNNPEQQPIKEETLKNILSTEGSTSFNTEQYILTMNRNFAEDSDLLTKCNLISERISKEVFQSPVKLSHFKNIVLWVRERLLNDYDKFDEIVDDEIIEEYKYFYHEVKKFEFNNFKYLSIFSAAFHVYKHFDEIVKMDLFKNYKRILDLPEVGEDNDIFAELTKSRIHEKLLKECFNFYFKIVPSKIFKGENLIFNYTCGAYYAFTYAFDDLVGAQMKFGFSGPLSIATIYYTRDDM